MFKKFLFVTFTLIACYFLYTSKSNQSRKEEIKSIKSYEVTSSGRDSVKFSDKVFKKYITTKQGILSSSCLDTLRDYLQDPVSELLEESQLKNCKLDELNNAFLIPKKDNSTTRFGYKFKLRGKIFRYMTKNIPFHLIDSRTLMILSSGLDIADINKRNKVRYEIASELIEREEFITQALDTKLSILNEVDIEINPNKILEEILEISLDYNHINGLLKLATMAHKFNNLEVLNQIFNALDEESPDKPYLEAMIKNLQGYNEQAVVDLILSNRDKSPYDYTYLIYEKTGKLKFRVNGGFTN